MERGPKTPSPTPLTTTSELYVCVCVAQIETIGEKLVPFYRAISRDIEFVTSFIFTTWIPTFCFFFFLLFHLLFVAFFFILLPVISHAVCQLQMYVLHGMYVFDISPTPQPKGMLSGVDVRASEASVILCLRGFPTSNITTIK